MSIWRHLRAIIALPVMVTMVLPAVIIRLTDTVQIGWGVALPYTLIPLSLGGGLINLGLLVVISTIVQFARTGHGTLAPWDPPQKLVVQGLYRYVRNPMISGVLLILLGETMLLGSLPLLGWCLLFLVAKTIYIPLIEERELAIHFGREYVIYQQNVPRWIPRFTIWAFGFPNWM